MCGGVWRPEVPRTGGTGLLTGGTGLRTGGAPEVKPECFRGRRPGSVRGMSSPESDEVGAVSHAVSP
ncbi:hypothetical protein GCM10018771_33950 [Streptomyces cellulosae]|nr:hypothetical protein GCM10018771_33950 [Streptomyces cellulosae]